MIETLAVDTITQRLANEVTVDLNLAVGGKWVVDKSGASLASEISIQDYAVVGLTTANEGLTVYGNTTIDGSCTVGRNCVQRARASGSTSSGGAALFEAP